MARPIKNGLAYFPFDTDFFSDIKVKRLRAQFGTDGLTVYIYLLCEIFRKGYCIEYDEDLILDISGEMHISKDLATQILNYLFGRSMLECILAGSVKVITSAEVQRIYQEAKKGSKRDIYVDERFWLLKENETGTFIKVRPQNGISENNESFSGKNENNSENNSIKKRKENKTKENETKLNETKENNDLSTEADVRAVRSTVQSDAEKIVSLYNEVCMSYPAVELKDSHIDDIAESLNEYSIGDFRKAFEVMEHSAFLKGCNDKGWRAQFGWAVKRKNLQKLVSGFYERYETHKSKAKYNDDYDPDIEKYNVVINKFDLAGFDV